MYKRYLIFFLILIAGAFLFWSSTVIQELFFKTVVYIESLVRQNPFVGVLTFIGLAALSAMLSPFSSIPLIPPAIIIWGQTLTVLFLVSGWIMGHITTYSIGYYAGYHIFKNFSFLGKINEYRSKISKKSEFLLVLLFRFSMPAEIPGYFLGIIKYPFGKYFLATFLVEFPFALLIVYGGNALLLRNAPLFIFLALLGFLILILTIYFLRKKLDRK